MQFKVRLSSQSRRQIENLKKQVSANNLSFEEIENFLKISEEGSYLGEGHKLENFVGHLVETLIRGTSQKNKRLKLSLHRDNLSTNCLELSHRYEHLLYWLSALGSGTREGFKKACETLQLPPDYKTLRPLKLLGHLENSQDGKRWSIAPTTIVKINSKLDEQEFVLCGQRSIKLIEKLKEYAEITLSHQPGGEAPACLHIKASNVQKIIAISEVPIVYVDEISLKLAEILPNLKTWQHDLKPLEGIVTSLYKIQYFDVNKNDFVECAYPSGSGMYSLSSPESKNNFSCSLFFDRERQLWLQADWNGLRFLAIQYQGISCQAWYDSKTKYLAIPRKQQWPEIYERALVLASGHLPVYQDGRLLYRNVSKKIVCLLSHKLNINWEEASILCMT